MSSSAKASVADLDKGQGRFSDTNLNSSTEIQSRICDELIDCLVAVVNDNDHDAAMSIARFILREDFINWDYGYRGTFLRKIAPAVLISAAKYNIPPSVIFGHAILESGWGRARLAQQYNNLFGIKGRGSNSVVVRTFEKNSENVRFPRVARFRVFNSVESSIDYHGDLLHSDRRYRRSKVYLHDWKSYIWSISKRYASEPRYANLVISIVKKHDLDRWDKELFDAHNLAMIQEHGI